MGVRKIVVGRVKAALVALDRKRSSVTILLTNDPEIRRLNRDYRQHDRATDVLSFHFQELKGIGDLSGQAVYLGDVVISIETAMRRAPRAKSAAGLARELERQVIHGLCHLFGHDHKRAAQARVMVALERRLGKL